MIQTWLLEEQEGRRRKGLERRQPSVQKFPARYQSTIFGHYFNGSTLRASRSLAPFTGEQAMVRLRKGICGYRYAPNTSKDGKDEHDMVECFARYVISRFARKPCGSTNIDRSLKLKTRSDCHPPIGVVLAGSVPCYLSHPSE